MCKLKENNMYVVLSAQLPVTSNCCLFVSSELSSLNTPGNDGLRELLNFTKYIDSSDIFGLLCLAALFSALCYRERILVFIRELTEACRIYVTVHGS